MFFRLLQGVAGAAMMPFLKADPDGDLPPREQAMAMAVWGIGMMVAPIMGPTVGWLYHRRVEAALEILHQRADWDLAAFMVYASSTDPLYMRGPRRGRVDCLGSLPFVTLGLGEIVLDRGERADWFASPGGLLLGGGARLAACLVFHELHTEDRSSISRSSRT